MTNLKTGWSCGPMVMFLTNSMKICLTNNQVAAKIQDTIAGNTLYFILTSVTPKKKFPIERN